MTYNHLDSWPTSRATTLRCRSVARNVVLGTLCSATRALDVVDRLQAFVPVNDLRKCVLGREWGSFHVRGFRHSDLASTLIIKGFTCSCRNHGVLPQPCSNLWWPRTFTNVARIQKGPFPFSELIISSSLTSSPNG